MIVLVPDSNDLRPNIHLFEIKQNDIYIGGIYILGSPEEPIYRIISSASDITIPQITCNSIAEIKAQLEKYLGDCCV